MDEKKSATKKTMSCEDVWNEIRKLEDQGVDIARLEDVFADFDCAWKQHADEYHEK